MSVTKLMGLLRSVVIYSNPIRGRHLRNFYCSFLRPGDLAFDIGAHVGNRARAMRSAGARVVALEPQAQFITFLRLTLPRDIQLVEAAAGSAETLAQMAVSSRHPTVSSLKTGFVQKAGSAPGFEHVRWDSVQQVRVTTLDRLIAQEGLPRYIKIDVEGYELEVLSGLSQPVEYISVEYLPGLPDLTLSVIDRIQELGAYQFNPVRGEAGAFLWETWRGAEATKAWLRSLSAASSSGDIYARLPRKSG